jgi:hypothetical protein
VLQSLPDFKSGDAMRFPLVRRGADVPELWSDTLGWETLPHVVLCDDLFEAAIGAGCGGPAEDAAVASFSQRLVDRWEAAPDRWVSVYLPPAERGTCTNANAGAPDAGVRCPETRTWRAIRVVPWSSRRKGG